MYKNVFLILCLAIACQAQIPFFGPCPSNIQPKQNFIPQNFLGKWYEINKYFAIFQAGGKCVKATYSQTLIPGTIGVFNEQLNFFTNIPSTIAGTATPVGYPTEGRYNVIFPNAPFPAPYWVLETDYVSFAVVYSCVNFNAFHFKFVWLLSRERAPNSLFVLYTHLFMESHGLPTALLQKTDQMNCPATH